MVGVSYEIGPFHLDPVAEVLTRAGAPTALGARGVAVLGELVEHANAYVSKRQLLDAAWPGMVVEENNLSVQVAAIRRVLAGGGGEGWIETLPRRGYRFVGPVRKLTNEGPAASGRPRSNLPAALTSFVGRERELVEIKRLLLRNRLVTIQGAGGIGKSRLTLQIASEVVDAYRDGVWVAELASLHDSALVAPTVAQLLGVVEETGKSPTESLCLHLKSRQVLLVLDNCEHLVDACARLADAILREAEEATIIATSREPLRLPVEQSYPLSPLSLPQADSRYKIRDSEAVQLLVERVQQQLPSFELTADREPAVAGICIHLDGMPLALELAAARARSLSVEQIHARLSDRFKLLTGGSRTALPRQQTLRATLDWSYDLLTEDERVVLRRLSVFPGSFTLEAASAVASDERIDEYMVIDLLAQLVARSLCTADATGDSARYRMLETTRAYALERLAEAGEIQRLKQRHARYFADRFERALYDSWRMPDAQWQQLYLPELDNVRAALDWAFGTGEASIGISLAGASEPLWTTLLLINEGARRLEAALDMISPQVPERDQAQLWRGLGFLRIEIAPPEAVAAFSRAAEIYRRLGDALALGECLVQLARDLALMGRFGDSASALMEASRAIENCAPPKLLGYYHSHFALLELLTGNAASAKQHYERAFAMFRDAEAEFAKLATLGNLADTAWALGDLPGAVTGYRRTVDLLRDSPTCRRRALGIALTNLSGVLTECGRLDEALLVAREGLPLARDRGYSWILLDHLALRAALGGGIENAARIAGFGDSLFAAKEAPRPPNEARAHRRLHTLLRETLAADDLERLLAEGAQLNEDQACRLALGE